MAEDYMKGILIVSVSCQSTIINILSNLPYLSANNMAYNTTHTIILLLLCISIIVMFSTELFRYVLLVSIGLIGM